MRFRPDFGARFGNEDMRDIGQSTQSARALPCVSPSFLFIDLLLFFFLVGPSSLLEGFGGLGVIPAGHVLEPRLGMCWRDRPGLGVSP